MWGGQVSRLGREHGQAIVELALVLPVLVLVLFGTLEFGRVFNAWVIVTQAAREGARVGAVQCASNAACATTVEAWVDDSLTGLDLGQSRRTVSPGPYTSGGTVEVDVEYDVHMVTPVIGNLVGNLLTVHGNASMRIE